MNQAKLDKARGSVLDQMEAGQKQVNIGFWIFAVLELALLISCALLVDWGDRTQVLLLVIFVLSYLMLANGFFILAGHMTRSTGRVLAVLAAQQEERR